MCKICRSEEWLSKSILILHHCEHLSYREIIERMKPYLAINGYNLSTHFARHLTQEDLFEAEQSKARWEKMKAEGKT